MSPGVALLGGILLAFAAVWGLQAWMARLGRAAEGREAAPVPGAGELEGRLLWFHSPTCGPCRAMHRELEGLSDRVVEVDVSRQLDVARAYGVMATPTTVRVKEGRVWVSRAGRLTRDELEEMLAL